MSDVVVDSHDGVPSSPAGRFDLGGTLRTTRRCERCSLARKKTASATATVPRAPAEHQAGAWSNLYTGHTGDGDEHRQMVPEGRGTKSWQAFRGAPNPPRMRTSEAARW
jgi:hypothetical protein